MIWEPYKVSAARADLGVELSEAEELILMDKNKNYTRYIHCCLSIL